MKVLANCREDAEESSHSLKRRFPYLSRIKPNRAIIVIAVIAVVFRLFPLTRRSANFAIIVPDSIQYLELAAGLRHGCGFARLVDGVCAKPEILRTPGYPLLLAARSGIRWVLLVQSLIAGALCWLLGHLVNRRWNVSAALLGEAALAVDIPSITAANEVLSDALFQFLLFVAVMGVLLATGDRKGRNNWLMASVAGMSAAFAIMTRPIAFILPLALPVPFLFSSQPSRRTRFAFAALVFAIPTTVSMAWITRNYLRTGYFGLSTVSSVNLCFFRGASVIALVTGKQFEQAQRGLGDRFGLILPQVYDAKNQSAKFAQQMTEMGEKILFAHPRETLLMTGKALIYLVLAPDRSGIASVLGIAGGYPQPHVGLNNQIISSDLVRTEFRKILESPVLMVLLFLQLGMIGLTWVGVLRGSLRSASREAAYLLWTVYPTAVAVLFIVLSAGGEATVRFRMPVVPLLTVAMAVGFFPEARSGCLKPRDPRLVLTAPNLGNTIG